MTDKIVVESEVSNISNNAVSLHMENLPMQNFGLMKIEKKELFNRLDDCVPIKDNLGKPINVKGYKVSKITLQDEKTGEIRNLPILYLFNDDLTYYITATTALKRFADLLSMFDLPDKWEVDGFNLVFDKKNKNGNTYYVLSVVD